MKKRRFNIGDTYYDIPETEVSSFLSDNPHAQEVKNYTVGDKEYNIPLHETDAFETDMGLKKKDGLPPVTPTAKDVVPTSVPAISQSQLQNGVDVKAESDQFDKEQQQPQPVPSVTDNLDSKNLIDIAKDYNDAANKKFTVPNAVDVNNPMSGEQIQTIPDPESQKQAKVLNDYGTKKGVDLKQVHSLFGDVPPEAYDITDKYGNKNQTKEQLISNYIKDPIGTADQVGNIKTQFSIQNAAYQNALQNGADEHSAQQHGMQLGNAFDDLHKVPLQNTADLYKNIQDQQQFIDNNLEGEAKDKALQQVQQNSGKFINPSTPTFMDEYNSSPYKATLDPNQYAGLKTLELFDPQKYDQAQKILNAKMDDKMELTSNFDFKTGESSTGEKETEASIEQQKGQQIIKKQLADLGRQNTITDNQSKFNNAYSDFQQATDPDQKEQLRQQALGIQNVIKGTKNDFSLDDNRYPMLAQDKFGMQTNEAMQQANMTPAENAIYHFGKGFENSANSVNNIVTSLFGSSADKAQLESQRLGEGASDQAYETMPSTLQSGQPGVAYKIAKPLQVDVNKILTNKSLSQDEKKQQVSDLMQHRQDDISTITTTGNENNFLTKATLYRMTGMLGDVGSIVAQSYGLGATGISKLMSASIPMFTTSQNDFYKQALAEGKTGALASGYANSHAMIMALAGMVNPDINIVKRSLGMSTALGKAVAGIDEATWDAVVNKNKPLLQKFQNAAKSIAGEAAKIGGVYGAGQSVASDLLDKSVYNKDISASDIANHAVKATKNAVTDFLPILGVTALTHFKSTSPEQKAFVWEAGTTPDIAKAQIDEDLKNGTITQKVADQRKDAVKTISNLIQTVPTENKKGKPLTDEQRADYLYNAVIKDKAKGASKDLPEAQQEILKGTVAQADAANNHIIEGTTQKLIETTPDKEHTYDEKDIPKELTGIKPTSKKDVETTKGSKYTEVTYSGQQLIDAGLAKDISSPKNQDNGESNKTNATQTEGGQNVDNTPTGAVDETAPLPEDKITVGDMLDKTGSYKGEKGSFYQDGQTVVFKVDGKNKEYELGNIDEIKNHPIQDYGIEHEQSVVKVDDNGDMNIRGESYKNNYSNPLAAINHDENGNVVSVNLETSDGKKRTFRGNIAEDLAYQIHLKEINKNDESANRFEQHINNDPAIKQQIEDAGLPKVTEASTTENNADVPREVIPNHTIEPPKITIETNGNAQTPPEDNSTNKQSQQSTTSTGEPTKQVPETPPPAGTGEETGTGGENDKTGVKKAITEPLRADLGLPKVVLPKMGKDADNLNAAKERVDSGKSDPRQLVNRILDDKGGYRNEDEVFDMQYYAHQLNAKVGELEKQKGSEDTPEKKAAISGQLQQLSDETDRFSEAALIAGNKWGKVGNAMQVMVDQSFNPSREKAYIKDAFNGEIPKDFQDRLDKAFKERDEAIARRNEVEAQLAKNRAQKSTNGTTKNKSKTHEDFAKDRANYIQELKDAKAKHEQWLKDNHIHTQGVSFTLTTDMLKAIGKIVRSYAEEGLSKAEDIADKVYDHVKDIFDGISKADVIDIMAGKYNVKAEQTDLAKQVADIRKQAKELSDANLTPDQKTKIEIAKLNKKADNIEQRIKDGKLESKKTEFDPQKNTEWIKANQRVANAEAQVRSMKRKAFESQKNFYQKSLMWAGRLFRISILSGKAVLYKLSAAAVIGGALKRPFEQGIGAVYNQIFRGIAEKAPIEGFTNIKSEMLWYKEFFNPKKFGQNAWEILKIGSSKLSKRLGGDSFEHVPILYLPTDLHQIIKDPVKRGTFEASKRNGMIWAEKNGLDIHDPLVIQTIENAAYKRANYEIFQESNQLTRWFKSQVSAMEKKGNIGATGKFLVDFMIPVSTVPTNIVRRLASTSPAGLIRGAYKVTNAYRKGLENLSNDEADVVMRQLKQGTLGTALWMAGWFAYKSFGGLYTGYNPDKKRGAGELHSDQMEVDGEMIPNPVQHAIPLEILQLSATARRVYEANVAKGEGSLFSIANAGLAAIGAMAEQIPVVETPVHAIEATGDPYQATKLKEDVKRRFEPQILRETGVIGAKAKPEPVPAQ